MHGCLREALQTSGEDRSALVVPAVFLPATSGFGQSAEILNFAHRLVR